MTLTKSHVLSQCRHQQHRPHHSFDPFLVVDDGPRQHDGALNQRMRSEMTTSRVTRSLRMSFVTTAMSKRIVAVTKRKWKTKLKTVVKRRRWVLEDRDDCAQRLANDSSNKKSSASVSIQWHPRHTPPQAAVIFDSNPDFVPRRYSFVAADYVPQACCSVHSGVGL
jgi:hypothetical protein